MPGSPRRWVRVRRPWGRRQTPPPSWPPRRCWPRGRSAGGRTTGATVPYGAARPGCAGPPVLLRGCSFDAAKPFVWELVEGEKDYHVHPYEEARYDVGFRVVIELPVD